MVDAARQLARPTERGRTVAVTAAGSPFGAQLISALELAVESDRERLGQQGISDPWFSLLDAAVSCIVSDQPEHVAQLYEEAKHFAPVNAEESMRRALQTYVDLDIGGRDFDPKWEIGCIGSNVQRAIRVLSGTTRTRTPTREPERIVLFLGLRLDRSTPVAELQDDNADAPAPAGPPRYGFPPACVEAAREAIAAALDEEIAHCSRILLGLAAAANGGDLLFHELCHERRIPTRMCLALPRPQYVGQYVAPAGKDWVERFSATYRQVREAPCDTDALALTGASAVTVFTDANELPRWLQGKPYYNVGRRNNLWMLQHAMTAAQELGENVEVSLLALWNEGTSEGGIGGIGDVIRLAGQHGIKVHTIAVPRPSAHRAAPLETAAPAEAAPAGRPNGRRPAAAAAATARESGTMVDRHA